MKFNTKYKYEKVSGFHFNKPSLTDQSQAFNCDINNVVSSCGIAPQQASEPIFGSTFDPSMYNDALNTIANAHSEFEKLPASVRREFSNDPAKFVEFLDNPTEDNCKKGVKLGIYKNDILKQFEKPIEPTLEPVNGDKVTPVISE